MVEAEVPPKKICYKCQRYKTLRSFGNDKTRPDGKYPYCRACRGKYMKAVELNGKRGEFVTNDNTKLCSWCEVGIGGTHTNRKFCSQPCKSKSSLAALYGLSISEYKQLIESMNGRCPICQREPKRWNIDHNHYTSESYGPVCTTCNTKLLAWCFHDPQIAKNLVDFLLDPPIRKMFGERKISKKKETSQQWHDARYEDLDEYPPVLHGRTRRKRQPRKRPRK